MNPNIGRGLPPLQTSIVSQQTGGISPPWVGWFNQVGRIVGQVPSISAPAANMVPVGGGTTPNDYTPDSWARFFYFQTDTGLLYLSRLVNNVWTWCYLAGTIVVALLADLPAGLGPGDVGLVVYELQYAHAYLWGGSSWSFLPGSDGSQFIVGAASAPVGGSWVLCDGGSADFSVGDGTIVTLATPNLATGGYSGGPVLLGGGGSGFQAATGPEWESTAKTETEATHTHNVGGVTVQSGSGATAGAAGSTGAGTAHFHALTDANAALKIPSDASDATHGGGMPDRHYLNWYMRQ